MPPRPNAADTLLLCKLCHRPEAPNRSDEFLPAVARATLKPDSQIRLENKLPVKSGIAEATAAGTRSHSCRGCPPRPQRAFGSGLPGGPS